MKKQFSNESGVTLIEILIGIVISVLMMAAIFTSYTAVNNTYSQVIDKAKISQSGRDIIGMLVRDVRIAGFKYFSDTSKAPTNYNPILIKKNSSGSFFKSSCSSSFALKTLSRDQVGKTPA